MRRSDYVKMIDSALMLSFRMPKGLKSHRVKQMLVEMERNE